MSTGALDWPHQESPPLCLFSTSHHTGRFDRQVTVDRPDVSGRIAILQVHSRGKQIGKDVDFDKVARRTPGGWGRIVGDAPGLRRRVTVELVSCCFRPLEVSRSTVRNVHAPGFTGADLANLMNEAAILAARRGLSEISKVGAMRVCGGGGLGRIGCACYFGVSNQ